MLFIIIVGAIVLLIGIGILNIVLRGLGAVLGLSILAVTAASRFFRWLFASGQIGEALIGAPVNARERAPVGAGSEPRRSGDPPAWRNL